MLHIWLLISQSHVYTLHYLLVSSFFRFVGRLCGPIVSKFPGMLSTYCLPQFPVVAIFIYICGPFNRSTAFNWPKLYYVIQMRDGKIRSKKTILTQYGLCGIHSWQENTEKYSISPTLPQFSTGYRLSLRHSPTCKPSFFAASDKKLKRRYKRILTAGTHRELEPAPSVPNVDHARSSLLTALRSTCIVSSLISLSVRTPTRVTHIYEEHKLKQR